MFNSDLIRPGVWVNINTNSSVVYDERIKEDIVKNPVFIITREGFGENLKAKLIDQRLNVLIWYPEYERSLKNLYEYGTVAGESLFFHAVILNATFENIKLTSFAQAILCAAQEYKKDYIERCPYMSHLFFKEGTLQESTECKK